MFLYCQELQQITYVLHFRLSENWLFLISDIYLCFTHVYVIVDCVQCVTIFMSSLLLPKQTIAYGPLFRVEFWPCLLTACLLSTPKTSTCLQPWAQEFCDACVALHPGSTRNTIRNPFHLNSPFLHGPLHSFHTQRRYCYPGSKQWTGSCFLFVGVQWVSMEGWRCPADHCPTNGCQIHASPSD